MNKIAKRTWAALALAGVLLLGLLIIVVRYMVDSPDWVTFQNSPHVYTDGVMNSGRIVDRSGTLLLDATNGKTYAESGTLRRAMLHLLGDREGNIPAFLLAKYGDELIGFAKSVAESICAEWEIPLEATGTGERFQTFNPD